MNKKEQIFLELVGLVWGLSIDTNFPLKEFNNGAVEIRDKYTYKKDKKETDGEMK